MVNTILEVGKYQLFIITYILLKVKVETYNNKYTISYFCAINFRNTVPGYFKNIMT